MATKSPRPDEPVETINQSCDSAEECPQSTCPKCGAWQLTENAQLLSDPIEQILFMQREQKPVCISDLYTCKKCGFIGTGADGGDGPEKDPNEKDKDKDKRLCKNCWMQTCKRQEIERLSQNKLKIDDELLLNEKTDKYDHVFGKSEHKLNMLGQNHREIMAKINDAVRTACIEGQLPASGEFEIFVKAGNYTVCIRGAIVNNILKFGTFFVIE
jgi:hypothetical protein